MTSDFVLRVSVIGISFLALIFLTVRLGRDRMAPLFSAVRTTAAAVGAVVLVVLLFTWVGGGRESARELMHAVYGATAKVVQKIPNPLQPAQRSPERVRYERDLERLNAELRGMSGSPRGTSPAPR